MIEGSSRRLLLGFCLFLIIEKAEITGLLLSFLTSCAGLLTVLHVKVMCCCCLTRFCVKCAGFGLKYKNSQSIWVRFWGLYFHWSGFLRWIFLWEVRTELISFWWNENAILHKSAKTVSYTRQNRVSFWWNENTIQHKSAKTVSYTRLQSLVQTFWFWKRILFPTSFLFFFSLSFFWGGGGGGHHLL